MSSYNNVMFYESLQAPARGLPFLSNTLRENPMQPIPTFVKKIALFAALTPEQYALLASAWTIKDCDKGDIFFVEGETAYGLYMMLQGKVKIFRTALDGREAVLHVFGAGELFGEVAVFQGGKFPATAQCVESGQTLFLPREALVRGIAAEPALAMNLLAALSWRLREFVNKVEALTLMETPQRLAAYLLHTSEENGGKDTFQLDVSKVLLAGMLGTARETLSRCLTRMVEQGMITMDGRKVCILDKKLLQGLVTGLENL